VTRKLLNRKSAALLLGSLTSTTLGITRAGAQTNPYVIRVGMGESGTAPSVLAALEFKRAVEANSKGRIQVQVYPANQLGTAISTMQQLKSGSVQMTGIAADYMAQFFPDMGIFGLLFLFPNRDRVYRALDGRLGDDIKTQIVARTGIRMLGIGDFGYKNVFSRKGAVQTVADLRGLKLRVIPNPIAIESFKALGVLPSTVDYSEVYTAIQQGVIDGGEIPFSTFLNGKLYEVAPYMSNTRHALSFMTFYMNDAFYRSLAPDLQKIVTDAGTKAAIFDRKASLDAETSARADLLTKGTKINEVAPAEIAKMRATQQPVYDHAKTIGPDAARWIQQFLDLK